ncbi:MAG: ASCH domain-containing protein [Promethearchaeota archaeon]
MIIHIMHLDNEPFKWIKSGKKTVEVRLFDEKRRKIEIGHEILFKELNGDGEVKAKVKCLMKFSGFRDLFSFIPKEYFAHESLTLEEQIERIRKYYDGEKEKKYGILAIWFEVLK